VPLADLRRIALISLAQAPLVWGRGRSVAGRAVNADWVLVRTNARKLFAALTPAETAFVLEASAILERLQQTRALIHRLTAFDPDSDQYRSLKARIHDDLTNAAIVVRREDVM
jgi:hypothetical protein